MNIVDKALSKRRQEGRPARMAVIGVASTGRGRIRPILIGCAHRPAGAGLRGLAGVARVSRARGRWRDREGLSRSNDIPLPILIRRVPAKTDRGCALVRTDRLGASFASPVRTGAQAPRPQQRRVAKKAGRSRGGDHD